MKQRTKRMVQTTVPTPIRPAIAKVFRGCKLKVTHNTLEEADGVAASIIADGDDTNPNFPLRGYKCDICFGFHVGHDTSNKR